MKRRCADVCTGRLIEREKHPHSERQRERSGGRKQTTEAPFSSFPSLKPKTGAAERPPQDPLGARASRDERIRPQPGPCQLCWRGPWLGREGGVTGKTAEVFPVRMGSGVAKLAAGGKAFPPEQIEQHRQQIERTSDQINSHQKCGEAIKTMISTNPNSRSEGKSRSHCGQIRRATDSDTPTRGWAARTSRRLRHRVWSEPTFKVRLPTCRCGTRGLKEAVASGTLPTGQPT